jgi:hypothetical protein
MEEARRLQRTYGVKVRDAIHIASALYAEAPVIETYDGPLLGLDNLIPGPLGSGPLVIRRPYFAIAAQGGLFPP